MEGDLIWAYEHTVQDIDAVLQNYTPELYNFIKYCYPQNKKRPMRKNF